MSASRHNMSLEELEARCDTLQRRVQDRQSSVSSQMRSPPRPYSPSRAAPGAGAALDQHSSVGRAVSPSVSCIPPVSPRNTHQNTTPQSYHSSATISSSAIHNSSSIGAAPAPYTPVATPAPAPVSQQQPTVGGANNSVVSPSEVSSALSSLLQERSKLEAQLSLVNTHIRAYTQLQNGQYAGGAPTIGGAPNPYNQPSAVPASVVNDTYQRASTPPRASAQTPAGGGGGTSSPSRHRSPARPHSSPPRSSVPAPAPSSTSNTSLQTEEIYKELQAIRKAREDREAQRRAALQAAATPQK